MRKYTRLQILKHALEYYMERPGATDEELKKENEVLKQITHEVNQFKEAHHIETKQYKVTHITGEEFLIEASGATSSKRKAFSQYKQLNKNVKYQQFMKDTKLDEIFLEAE